MRQLRPPDEESADRSPDADAIAVLELVYEGRRHLPAGQPCDGDLDQLARCDADDGEGSHGLIPVRSGEPYIQVLAGVVARPTRARRS